MWTRRETDEETAILQDCDRKLRKDQKALVTAETFQLPRGGGGRFFRGRGCGSVGRRRDRRIGGGAGARRQDEPPGRKTEGVAGAPEPCRKEHEAEPKTTNRDD